MMVSCRKAVPNSWIRSTPTFGRGARCSTARNAEGDSYRRVSFTSLEVFQEVNIDDSKTWGTLREENFFQHARKGEGRRCSYLQGDDETLAL
jgi:hypothetical protein